MGVSISRNPSTHTHSCSDTTATFNELGDLTVTIWHTYDRWFSRWQAVHGSASDVRALPRLGADPTAGP
jgi:hypothetical protein